MTTAAPTAVPKRRPLFARRRRTAHEHGIQVGLFDWRAIAVSQLPELALLHAIPNGAALKHSVKVKANGKRVVYSAEGARLRREGLTAGILDVSWPVPRGPYHGLYIEHKSADGSASDEQVKISRMLIEQGYYVAVSRDSLTSINLVREYWNLGAFSPECPSTLAVPVVPRQRKRRTPTPTPA